MFMIVICHMFSYYRSELALWFNVGVQVFFVISGFLYGAKDIISPIDYLKRNFRKVLIPYWLFLIIAVICYFFVSPNALNLSSIVRAFTCSGLIDGLGHLWFVGYILFCYLLTPYLYWFRLYLQNKSFYKSIAYYAILFVLIQICGFLFDSFFEPDKISCYVLGFFLADLFSRFNKVYIVSVKCILFISALVLNCGEICVKYFSNISFAGWEDLVFRALCRYAHMFLGVAIFLLLYGKFHGCRYSCLLRLSDRYSYSVYLVHQLFILSPLSLMSFTNLKLVNWGLVIVCILFSSFLLYQLSKFLERTVSSVKLIPIV